MTGVISVSTRLYSLSLLRCRRVVSHSGCRQSHRRLLSSATSVAAPTLSSTGTPLPITSHLTSELSSTPTPSPSSDPSTLHLLLLHMPILDQLRLEEALLRVSPHSYLIINTAPPSTPPSVVLGISGRPELWLHIPAVRASGMTTIRRFTGGGTVYCDASTFFVTFSLARRAIPGVQPYPASLLSYAESMYAPLFPPGAFDVRGNDFCVAGRKFAGNAQAITRTHLLHHTSLLWHADTDANAPLPGNATQGATAGLPGRTRPRGLRRGTGRVGQGTLWERTGEWSRGRSGWGRV